MLKKLRLGKEKTNARRLQRYHVESECEVETGSGTYSGLLKDLSPVGARLETDASVEMGEQVTIRRADASSVTGHVVRVEEGVIALEFPMNAESVSYAFKALTEPMLSAANSQPVKDDFDADMGPNSDQGPSENSDSDIEEGDA